MKKEFPKEKVFGFYQKAPSQVQAAFSSEETVETILSVQKAYGLHTDTTGMLGKEIGYLLLGITNPKEFFDRLHANGLPEETVSNIVRVVNEKIFVPLQRKMREVSQTFPTEYSEEVLFKAPERETIPSVPLMQVGEVLKITPQMVSEEGLPTVVTPALVVTPPPPSIPNIPAYEEATLQTYKPVLRTMASDMEALAHPNKIVETNASQPSPARSFQTSSVPKTEAMGQIFLPRVSAVFESPKSPEMSIEPPTFRYHEELSVPSTPSTSRMDPYREPVE